MYNYDEKCVEMWDVGYRVWSSASPYTSCLLCFSEILMSELGWPSGMPDICGGDDIAPHLSRRGGDPHGAGRRPSKDALQGARAAVPLLGVTVVATCLASLGTATAKGGSRVWCCNHCPPLPPRMMKVSTLYGLHRSSYLVG